MKCRMDIKGRKIWVDDNNSHNTRPSSIEIVLYRDGEAYKTLTLDSLGDGDYVFPCLIIWKNNYEKYNYTVDETSVPNGYTKRIQGYNVSNVLNEVELTGIKTWADDYNSAGARPTSITLHLFQNGVEIDTLSLDSPPDTETTSEINFGIRPFVDADGVPYAYTLTEDDVEDYDTEISGMNITNTYREPIPPFIFNKTSARTGMSLEGAKFELRQQGEVKASAESDENGNVSFIIQQSGVYQLMETQPPAGYMDDITVYEVVVSDDGTITVDGNPSEDFSIQNNPIAYDISLERAVKKIEPYNTAPNTWALHGLGETDLYMADKILISAQGTPSMVRWDYGVRSAEYFSSGGGFDITDSYQNGIPISSNGSYTVYGLFSNGYESVSVITIDNIRDGSVQMPYLLLDYETAESLEELIHGLGVFVLDYFQSGGARLTQNYEIYEDIDMQDREWTPVGLAMAEYFTGTLYGNGHDIKNLLIDLSSPLYTGLFSRVAGGARIEKLGLIDCNIRNESAQAGGFAGYIDVHLGQTVTFKDLTFTGAVTSGAVAGGIVAYVNSSTGVVLIEGCTVNAELSGSTVGGVIGMGAVLQSDGVFSITDCVAHGAITSQNNAGGILGNSSIYSGASFSIEKCVSLMTIQSENIAGGILGVASASNNGRISSCINRGDVMALHNGGGIAGSLTCAVSESMFTIENCYNTAQIIAETGTAVRLGGLVGICHNYINIKNSYNVGNVISEASSAFVGAISGNYGKIENCASINDITSNTVSNVARISPETSVAEISVLTNNVAFNNMKTLINGVQKAPMDVGGSQTDGADVVSSEITAISLYETTLQWDFTDTWLFGNADYTLPVLKAIPLSLQPDTLPNHLIQSVIE